MIVHPLKFLKQVLWYSGGSVIGKIVILFLLPLTTAYLTPADYGIIGILLLLATFISSILQLGFHTSLGRVYALAPSETEKEGVVWTTFLGLVCNNIFWVLIFWILSPWLSYELFGNNSQAHLITLAVIGVAVAAPQYPFEYYLRTKGRVKFSFGLKIVDVFSSIGSILFMVVYLKRGPLGYMEAIILSQAIGMVTLLLLVAPKLRFQFNMSHLKELLIVGLPCIYGLWGYFILLGASRISLQMLETEENVGLYFLGNNIGRIMELPLWGFSSAWVPYFNHLINKKEIIPSAFRDMMTRYLLGVCCLIVPLFCLAKPVVYFFVNASFHEIWKVVGLSGVSMALWGVYMITYPPLIYFRKTFIQSALELGSGILCILLNFLMIPSFGMMGAAYGTFISFAVLCIVSGFINSKYIYVPYDYARIIKVLFGTVLAASVSFLPLPMHFYLPLMISTILLFLVYCWAFVLTPNEKSSLSYTMVSN